MLKVYNTFTSLQGESSFSGLPCYFIRLAGCFLRCSYCDTQSAQNAVGKEFSVSSLVDSFVECNLNLVEVTGGEPLMQNDCFALLTSLADTQKKVLLETSGAVSILKVDPRVHIIMDIKCPDSKMSNSLIHENLEIIKSYSHELKFVISSKSDFNWVVNFVKTHSLFDRVLLLSPVIGRINLQESATWILQEKIAFRLHLQLHKIIWPEGGDCK